MQGTTAALSARAGRFRKTARKPWAASLFAAASAAKGTGGGTFAKKFGNDCANLTDPCAGVGKTGKEIGGTVVKGAEKG
jgi:hypothetical protein